jgi:hypothetical protein
MLYDDWGHDLQSIEVPANEPCYFLDQYSVIDYLWIDVEGLDTDIVQYIDFTKYKIKQIRFESAHSDGKFVKGIKYQNAIIKLTQANYLLHSDGLDTVGYLA